METHKETFENEYAMFWITGGILYFTYREGVNIDLNAAKKVVADRLHFQNETALPILCDSRGVSSVDKSARNYLATSGSLLAKAVALLVKENVSRTMSTFYLEISKPAVPTQIFTLESNALAFLTDYK